MADAYGIVLAASAPPRGGVQADTTIHCQYIEATRSWGVNPGSGIVRYVGGAAPVTAGAAVRIDVGGHTFWGVCRLDTLADGTNGRTRTLEWVDNREFLHWDYVFGAFNKAETRIVNGQRVRRYRHLFPADYLAGRWTYTAGPLSARQILDLVFTAGTVLSPWVRVYHPDQNAWPVFDVDCLSGKTLAAVVAEVSEKQGLVVGHVGGVWSLVWVRKGEGNLPAFPANSNHRRSGLALSGNHTRVVVLGDPNQYQVLDVPLARDWAPAWERFVVVDQLAEDLFKRGSDAVTGARLNALPGDVEHYQGWQLALALASTITVRDYVALRNAVPLPEDAGVNGSGFADYRMFAGRSRMDMPAALYIRALLFRAFRPTITQFVNGAGALVPAETIEDRLLTRVTHHPTTGMMTEVPGELPSNGYAIVKGFQVGAEAFRSLRPEQFRLDLFADSRAVWAPQPFQLDDSGDEAGRFLIFDEPLVVSENLLNKVGKHVVINAAFTLQVPPARAALVYRGERYTLALGVTGRDLVESVPGLHGEYIVQNGAVTRELPFADGEFSYDKGLAVAGPLLSQQFYYAGGGYTVAGSNGTQLSPVIDRVQIQTGPQGMQETVDFTNERGRNAFIPERVLDRDVQLETLFPGQAELNEQARYARALAAGFKQNPRFAKDLGAYLSGTVESEQPVQTTCLMPGGTGTVAVGTPLRRRVPTAGSPNTDTTAALPAQATSQHKIFGGVTVRDNERGNARGIRVQSEGVALVRVKGPVAVNDAVGLKNPTTVGTGTDAMEAGADVPCGTALDTVAEGATALIAVRLGGGGGGGGLRWRGEWEDIAYSANDVVIRGSENLSGGDPSALDQPGKAGTYVALRDVPQGSPAPEEPNAETYWETLARYATHAFTVGRKEQAGVLRLRGGGGDASLAAAGGMTGGVPRSIVLDTGAAQATGTDGTLGRPMAIRAVRDCEPGDPPNSVFMRLVLCSSRYQVS